MKKVGAVLAAAVAIVATVRALSAQPEPRLQLQFEDYAQLPVTGELDGQNTRGQLARVNVLHDEPGGRRLLRQRPQRSALHPGQANQEAYCLPGFQRPRWSARSLPEVHLRAQLRHGPHQFRVRPRLRTQRRLLYAAHGGPKRCRLAGAEAGAVPGLDLTGYTTTPAVPTPTVEGRIEREVVLIEWTDRDPANATFEGKARELLRVQHPLPQHPLGELTFNPVARSGDPDWRVMYLGAGDSGSGDQRDSRRINPQRLDTLVGKVLRIVPDLASTRRPARSARTAAIESPTTIPSPPSRALVRRSGPTVCAIRIG